MSIEREYLKYYYLVGLYLLPEDEKVADDQNRIVYISIDHNRVYLQQNENPDAIPVMVEGYQWSWLWWMYRLSERKCSFPEYLGEYMIPVCRKYIVQERKRLKEKKDKEEE